MLILSSLLLNEMSVRSKFFCGTVAIIQTASTGMVALCVDQFVQHIKY